MAQTEAAAGLPSLLVEAARSAAEADGVETPTEEATPTNNETNAEAATAAAATLTSIGVNKDADPMEQARAAIAAQKNMVESAPTAGTAAFLASTNIAPPPAASTRRMTGATSAPAPAPASNGNKKKGPPLRRGKWTPEEEAYANRLIQEFKAGLLPLSDGTTLRTFLSKLLNCDPMRISKKFVGNNCIGKQVFRRRTADINRLTPEQIQQSRIELSELERRFLERVAQTNRVKSSGVGAGAAGPGMTGIKLKDEADSGAPAAPWLQPPLGYKHGTGAAMAAANLSGGIANSRAAAAGRALLMGLGGRSSNQARKGSNPSLTSSGSAGLLALAGSQSFQNAFAKASATNLLAAATAGGSGLSGSAMAQIARNASAARLANLTAGGNSMNNLMMQTGLSRDQLNALASGNSLSNMMERQSSFDALMSLDFQSLQSIDNLANLIQTNGGAPGQVPENGMKNWQPESANNSSANLADARRLASVGRMESLLRSLSSGNVNKDASSSSSNTAGSGSNANFSNLIQSMQNSNSTNSLFGGNSASAASLANLLRADSSTGLTALRMQDGLNQRNTSVDDFLSLVASGEISHHDPLLNVPMNVQHQGLSQGQAAQLIAQQQLMAQASASGNSALANALRAGSIGNLQKSNNSKSEEVGQDEKAATADEGTSRTKRKLDDEGAEEQGPSKR